MRSSLPPLDSERKKLVPQAPRIECLPSQRLTIGLCTRSRLHFTRLETPFDETRSFSVGVGYANCPSVRHWLRELRKVGLAAICSSLRRGRGVGEIRCEQLDVLIVAERQQCVLCPASWMRAPEHRADTGRLLEQIHAALQIVDRQDNVIDVREIFCRSRIHRRACSGAAGQQSSKCENAGSERGH